MLVFTAKERWVSIPAFGESTIYATGIRPPPCRLCTREVYRTLTCLNDIVPVCEVNPCSCVLLINKTKR